ncbi:MAG: DUF4190 domain-containing protein [Flavobacteriia bacterium]
MEWKTSVNKSQAQDNSSNSSSSVDQRIENSSETTPSNSQTMNVVEAEQANETSTYEAHSSKDVPIEENQSLESKNATAESADRKQLSVMNPIEPRVDPLGILSIVSGSIALIFLLNICFLLSDNGWNAIFGLSYPWLFFIVLVFAVVGLILAIKSIKHIRQNPELYKRKNIAWTGFGISAASLGFVVLTLLILALVYLFETFFYW